MTTGKQPPFTPADALDALPRIAFDPHVVIEEHDFRQAELMQSVLAIARVDHLFESELVRAVVETALGHVPEPED
jgi:hypothetical protein